ncbi:hypothetical protein A9K75_06545 [Campylobacter fetus subsp. testudinum]|uniref:hypothetical protein n=1 Tax=Campylobacter fetus TaxID=196 RepID=UPI0008188173|nr:hypothetical protein [Campylobacter fetus]OCR99524.1 hypothetical protein A9K75_06545 [Campylobacter fetus subsp. testudinum]
MRDDIYSPDLNSNGWSCVTKGDKFKIRRITLTKSPIFGIGDDYTISLEYDLSVDQEEFHVWISFVKNFKTIYSEEFYFTSEDSMFMNYPIDYAVNKLDFPEYKDWLFFNKFLDGIVRQTSEDMVRMRMDLIKKQVEDNKK